MKKTALTFGLFSLVMVATSFANPTTSNTILNENASVVRPVDGSAGGGRKQDDPRIVQENLMMKNNELGFANINQSLGNKKLD